MIQDHFKTETEAKGWGGMTMGNGKQRGGGTSLGIPSFKDSLGITFFKRKKIRQKQRCN